MKRSTEYIVVPFTFIRGQFRPGHMRLAGTAHAAIRLAEILAEHNDGSAAFEVVVEHDTGELTCPRLLAVHGEYPDIEELLAEAA